MVAVSIKPAAASPPVETVSVSAVNDTGNGSLTGPAISSTATNQVLIAFVATPGGAGPSANPVTAVSGGGLTWTRAVAQSTQFSSAEVWYAVAAAVVTNVVITATKTSPVAGGFIEVTVWSGADTVNPIAATASASGASGAATVSLTTAAVGSQVWGVGATYGATTVETVGAGQAIDLESDDLVGKSWLQHRTATTATAGTSATINDTAPTASRWDLSMVEIQPGAPSTPTKVVFTTQPGGSADGAALSPQPAVSVEDSGSSVVATDTSTVTLAIASGSGTLTCTGGLSRAAVAGVATFSGCSITGTTGNFTLTATDGALTPATSNSFAITVGPATKVAFTTQPGGAVNGAALSPQPVLSVEDTGGNVVTADTSAVTLAVASGTGTLTCSGGQSKAAVSGVASFAGCVITGTSGSFTLTATDGALISATSNAFTISAAAASKVIFTTQPGTGVDGAALSTQPVVSVEDALNNVVASDTSTVTLGIASGTGTLACAGGLAKAAVSGVATFSGCSITGSLGNFTLAATDGSLTAAASNSFAITVGPATQVAFTTQPGGAVDGIAQSTQPVLTVEDVGGNVVTTDTSTLTLAIASGTGSLACMSGQSKAAASGVANFAGCKITGLIGTFTLSASDGALTAATSNGFTITIGPASKVVFTTQPVGNVYENADLSTQPVVTVEDVGGNPTGTTSVTLTINSGPAAGVLGCTTNPLAAVSGVASFAGCKITGTLASGTYTLRAADGALTTDNSFSFVINGGSLSVSASASFTLSPNLTPGAGMGPYAIPQLTLTNTLFDAATWSATMSATDLYDTTSSTVGVPFTNMTIGVDQAPIAQSGAFGSVTPGTASQALSGSDATPGTTQSSPVTLLTGPGNNGSQGSWTMNNTISLLTPASSTTHTYQSTIQYTILG